MLLIIIKKPRLRSHYKNTLEVKLNSDFELIKGLNECDDAYRVIPHPTARPYQEDMVDPTFIYQDSNSIYIFNDKHRQNNISTFGNT